MSYFLSFAAIFSSLCNWKGAQSYKKLSEAIVPKLGHGPKMGQIGFDRACVSVVFLFLLCFIAHSYEANGGTDMEVLACFRPGFSAWLVCVCEKYKNCQWMSHNQVDRFEWKFRCTLQLASNREPPLASTIGPIFPHNLGWRKIFAILWTLISRKLLKISENREDFLGVKFKDLRLLFYAFFRYLWRFSRYFEKSLSGAKGYKNNLPWVKIRLNYFSYLVIQSLSWTAQSRQYFPKIRLLVPRYLKNVWGH